MGFLVVLELVQVVAFCFVVHAMLVVTALVPLLLLWLLLLMILLLLDVVSATLMYRLLRVWNVVHATV